METRFILLKAIYEVYEEFAGGARWACQPGCDSCCTLHVTATTLEAEYLIQGLDEARLERVRASVERTGGNGIFRPLLTTNALARLCLNRIEPPEDEPGSARGSCPLLKEGLCSVYEVRPFGCRLMVSQTPCHRTGAAIAPPELVTVNVVTQQIIEHLDRGGRFGNMLDVLKFVWRGPEAQPALALSEPLPGYLVPPGHMEYANEFLRLLSGKQTSEGAFGKVFGER